MTVNNDHGGKEVATLPSSPYTYRLDLRSPFAGELYHCTLIAAGRVGAKLKASVTHDNVTVITFDREIPQALITEILTSAIERQKLNTPASMYLR